MAVSSGAIKACGVSGGLRAVQLEKQLVTTLKMMPMVEGVAVPMVASLLDENRAFAPNELIVASAKTMLDELHRWAEGPRPKWFLKKLDDDDADAERDLVAEAPRSVVSGKTIDEV